MVPDGWLSPIKIEPLEAQSLAAFLSGKPARIGWAIRNDGPEDISETFSVGIYLDELALIEFPVESLAAGESLKIEDSQAYLYGDGEYAVRLRVDNRSQIDELSEEDNEATVKVLIAPPAPTPTPTPVPAAFNLRVSSLSLASEPREGETALIDWSVVNEGEKAVGSRSIIEFRLNGELRAVVETHDLRPGETHLDSDTDIGDSPDPGSALIEAEIRPLDPEKARSERNRDDNRLSLRVEWRASDQDLWRDAPEVAFTNEELVRSEKELLRLINRERTRASLGAVSLAHNAAAQRHAEDMLSGCYLSHWNQYGLKPYMRYTLSGGESYSRENAAGLSYCYEEDDRIEPISEIEPRLARLMDNWMASAGHRKNILDPRHTQVSLGLAWDRNNLFGVQLFAADYLTFDSDPSLNLGRISLNGKLQNGASLRSAQDLAVRIYYDPPPRPLTRGQLARTYCYGFGPQVAQLRPPPEPSQIYQINSFEIPRRLCPEPSSVSSDAKAPKSPSEANALHQAAYQDWLSGKNETTRVEFVTSELWDTSKNAFRVSADISEILEKYGPGVYTATIQARLSDEFVTVSEVSLFHATSPPDSWQNP